MEKGGSVCDKFCVDSRTGLLAGDVGRRTKHYGENALEKKRRKLFAEVVLEQFNDRLVHILLVSAAVSGLISVAESGLTLGALTESLVILLILLANSVVGALQETNAESAIDALLEYAPERVKVLRDGELDSVETKRLVPGDIVELGAGDRVPADIVCLEIRTGRLAVDQSIVTGESESVEKSTVACPEKRNILYSGTVVTAGCCRGVVCRTGKETFLGGIQREIECVEKEKTPLEEELDRFGVGLSFFILWVCIFVWCANIRRFSDPVHGGLLGGAFYYLKVSVALAVAAVPEGLTAVLTTCFALSTRRMAQKNAIVRKLSTVETLGCTSVICTDKTGTITTNQMCVQQAAVLCDGCVLGYAVEGSSYSPEGGVKTAAGETATGESTRVLYEIAVVCVMCSETRIVYRPKKRDWDCVGEPTEGALLVLAEKIKTEDGEFNRRLVWEDRKTRGESCRSLAENRFARRRVFGFTREKKMMSVLCYDQEKDETVLLVKGAFEEVVERSSFYMQPDGDIVRLAAGEKERLLEHGRMLGRAHMLRVLALAKKTTDSPGEDGCEDGLVFLGMAGMADPPRAEVRAAVRDCAAAGIRVVVITGDNTETAQAVCRSIGLVVGSRQTYTGAELDSLGEEARRGAFIGGRLFARVTPQHKRQLVQTLKQAGEAVVMTGDGVNDAPALKQADVGVAMGRGSDVARLSSDLILLDNNFSTIVSVVREGRVIYTNIRLFLRYLLSSNIGEVVCVALGAVCGLPEILSSVQLLWVNLVTDGLPATALGFNAEDGDVMNAPPRRRGESIATKKNLLRYLVVGSYVGLAAVASYIWVFVYSPNGPQTAFRSVTPGSPVVEKHCSHANTVALSTVVVLEMFNALNCLSETESLLAHTPATNKTLLGAISVSVFLHLLVVYVPFLQRIFGAVPLGLGEWLFVVLVSFPVVLIEEGIKFCIRRSRSVRIKLE
ncbi:MAG: calcium-translocating P-type ATPase [Amphiamblys sp. WSBS2006]|nr:MAG: calcium-translocating P-type ATPase [Amphiamblys sp. WSBS2006]